MIEQEINAQSIVSNVELNSGYINEDIIILDNVRKFIEPDSVRMEMNAIVLCTDGRAQGIMNKEQLEILKNQVVMLPPGVKCTDLMISPDFEFKALFLTNRILQQFLHDKMAIWNKAMYINKIHIYTMQREEDMAFYNHIYELIQICIENKNNNPLNSEIIQSLLRSAVLAICGEFMRFSKDEGTKSNYHFQRFIDILSSGKVRHRSVESYAEELCITPKYLSTICKTKSGKTANQWITEYLMEEIRYQLKQTTMSIKEISNSLGFPNPSFFGRFVKDHSGMTPLQMRNE